MGRREGGLTASFPSFVYYKTEMSGKTIAAPSSPLPFPMPLWSGLWSVCPIDFMVGLLLSRLHFDVTMSYMKYEGVHAQKAHASEMDLVYRNVTAGSEFWLWVRQ